MTNEIKELIDNIKKIIEENRKNDFNHIILQSTSMEQLLDYITNLQQRIDKANQLIEKQKKKMYKSRNKIAMYILINLENILRGDE